eukprot:TRINITY_DN43148_c0_g1_i4.p1 TRINITY_DN43148_c0_g1~~TRINITY_DN43148_c0_g1_i4.p1  ORF type:complete len:145 (+),score=43.85 TRINITY_DN43148_c0_g1_i4:63-497(+)
MPGKKKPKGTRNAGVNLVKRELIYKEEEQEYALVTALAGNRRVQLECMDGVKRLGLIRGSMKRGAVNRVRNGDVVLVCLRDYQDEKCDVVHKYDGEEVHRLKSYGEIEPHFKVDGVTNSTEGGLDDMEDDVEFADFSDGDIDDI